MMTPEELEMYLRALQTGDLPDMGSTLFQAPKNADPLGYVSVPTDQLPSMGVSEFTAPGSGGAPMETMGMADEGGGELDILNQLLQQFLEPQAPAQVSPEFEKDARRQAFLQAGAAMLAAEGGDFGSALGQGGLAYGNMMKDLNQEELNRLTIQRRQDTTRAAAGASVAGNIASMERSERHRGEDRDLFEADRTHNEKRSDDLLDEERKYTEGRDDVKRGWQVDDQKTIHQNAMARAKYIQQLETSEDERQRLLAHYEQAKWKDEGVRDGWMPEEAPIEMAEHFAKVHSYDLAQKSQAEHSTAYRKPASADISKVIADNFPQYERYIKRGLSGADEQNVGNMWMKDNPGLPPEAYVTVPEWGGLPRGMVDIIERMMYGTTRAAPSEVVKPGLPPAD